MKLEYKGFLKLTVQIGIMSATMIIISIFTDTQIWTDHFNFTVLEGECNYGGHNYNHKGGYKTHQHWNYRAFVYTITGAFYFIINCIRIGMSHKEEDFISSKKTV